MGAWRFTNYIGPNNLNALSQGTKLALRNEKMFTKENYMEMILDELDFQEIEPSMPKNKFIAYLGKARKTSLIKFYEILCDECELFTILNLRTIGE